MHFFVCTKLFKFTFIKLIVPTPEFRPQRHSKEVIKNTKTVNAYFNDNDV